MKNKKVITNIILTNIIFILGLLICYGYVSGHYSADDYNIINKGYNEYSIVNNLKEGRPIMFLIDQFALHLNMDYMIFIRLTVIIAILFTSINVVIIYNQFIDNIKTNNTIKVVLLLAIFAMIFNFTYIENLYFVESIVMALALVCYSLSAKYLIAKGKANLIKGFVFSLLAILLYNGFECYFITITVLFTIISNYKYNDKIYKELYRNVLIAIGMIVITVLINIVQIKITCIKFNIVNNRLGNFAFIFRNIEYILKHLPEIIINTMGLFPKYLYIVIIVVLSYAIIAKSVLQKDYKQNINLLLLIVISIFSCFAVSIISLSSFGTGRLSYGIGMTIGLILLLPFVESFWKKKNIFTYFWIFFIIAYFVFNIYNYIYILNSHKQVNALEKEEVNQIQKYVRCYEKESNIQVKKLAFVYIDNKYGRYYEKKKKKCGVTTKGTACEWSCLGTIKFYSNLELEKTNLTTEQFERFLECNTTKPVCIDDMLICTVYDW